MFCLTTLFPYFDKLLRLAYVQYVQLDFTEFRTVASRDFVTIYDGANAQAQMLARLNGYYGPAPTGFQSTQRHMFVLFVSDAVDTDIGFKADFQSMN